MDTGTYIHRTARPETISRPFGCLVRWVICVATLFLSSSALRAQNPIQIENAKPGTTSWEATNLADAQPPSYTNVIEGYTSLTSVDRGGQITFFVNVATPGDSFTMNIYRMGWYGGKGARLVMSIGPLTGVQQTMPTPDPATGLIECNWTPSYVLTLDSTTDPVSNWVSGVYTVLLTDTTSTLQRYMVFVVRDDASTAKYFFQSAVDTYQAYNNWGGKSLYAFDSDPVTGPATKISFNRPYQSSYGYDGAGDFIDGWEYDAVRFLEREGYDVTYGTDIDAHERPSLLLSHKAILIVGHSEYWSMAMRTNIIAARDAGVSLGIFGANVCYWQVRFEPSTVDSVPDRTMVGYKDYSTSSTSPGPDPYYTACQSGDTASCKLITERWRDPEVNMPENAFIGIMYEADPVDGDIVITNASDPVFNTTGLQNNDTLPGLLGYEVDGLFSNGQTPAGIVTLATSPFTTTGTPPVSGTANMTMYTAGSGATVFAAGTFQLSWGLDDYSVVLGGNSSLVTFAAQQMTRNLLAKFIGDQPPVASVGGPYTGATHQSIQFNGTASSDPDGTVSTYQWDYGDGSSGTGSFPTHSYAHSGTYTVTLIVADDAGSRNAATTTATITDQPIASLSANSLAFDNQLVGTSSTATPVALTNTGAAALTITSIVPTGDTSETNNCPGSLGAGNTCTLNIKFAPTATGARSGTITITDNNLSIGGSTQTVTLSGTGTAPVAGVLPSSLAFKNQLVSTPSLTQSTVLKNTGTAPLTIASIVPTGDYSQSNNCGGSVATGSSCTITVTFTPTTTGARPGAITITDNNNAVNNSTQTVTLSGMGTLAVATFQPPSLNFGIQLLGSSPQTQATTVTNNGTVPVTFSSFAVSGDFSVAGSGTTCSTSSPLAINTACTIAVTFAPSAAGPRKSAVVINDDAAGGPHAVFVTGVGTAAKLSPATLTFTDQTVGTPSTPQSITLTNTGASPMNIWQTAFLGANPSDFSITTNCGSTLGAGSSCKINVTFTPGGTGARAASFVVSDDGGSSPQGVTLGGMGVAPSLPASSPITSPDGGSSPTVSARRTKPRDSSPRSGKGAIPVAISNGLSASSPITSPDGGSSPTVSARRTKPRDSSPRSGRGAKPVAISNGLSASSLSFGRQQVGTSAAPKSVLLTNAGDTTMTIGGIEIFGAGHDDFSVTNDCASELGPGKSCSLKVSFKPRKNGVRKVTVHIEDGTQAASHEIKLQGVGVQ
jgi:N,N-dimethylformamidase beta subunit-like, C-terminal/PKD domain/HYDIN/CFA65/VesB-like, Ig-like domain/Cep192 domain 4/Abnormal spindle-like microcephaly-assoc'd, ASPM-SPD-2-Hydin